jgi:hypothetical protein
MPAVVFYDFVSNTNYLLNNWYLPTNSYLFTDFPIYLILGLLFNMNPLTVKISAFTIYCLSILPLCATIANVFGKRAATLCAASFLCAPLFISKMLVHPYIRTSTIGISFLCLYLITSHINETEKHIGPLRLMTIFVLSALSVFSDPYFISSFTVPFIGAYLAFKMLGSRTLDLKTTVPLLLSLAVSAVAGLYLQKVVWATGLNLSRVPADFIAPSEVLPHLRLFFLSMSEILNIGIDAENLMSPDSLFKLINLALLVFVTIGTVKTIRHEKSQATRLLILYLLFSGVLLCAAYLFKSKPLNLTSARYIIPVIYIYGALFSIVVTGNLLRARWLKAILILFVISASFNIYIGFRFQADQSHMALVKTLRGNKLQYGYSDYWDSNIVTLLSNNEIRVRPVNYSKYKLTPHYWANNQDWYKPSRHEGATFLIVPDNYDKYGFKDLNPFTVRQTFGAPERSVSLPGYKIYIWPYNLMLTQLRTVVISEKTPHSIGMLELDSIGYVLHSKIGQRGYLMYGPYWQLRQGRYRARFVLKVSGEVGTEVTRIEVTETDVTASRYEPKSITRGITVQAESQWHEYTIDFDAGDNRQKNLVHEFKVFSTGKGAVKVGKVSLEEL